MRSLHFEATERAHDDRVRKFLYFTPVAATMYRPAHEFSRDHAQPDFHIKCMLSKDGRLAVAQRQVYVAFSGKRRLPIRRLTVQALRITRLFRGDCAWTEFPNPSLDGLSIAFGTAS